MTILPLLALFPWFKLEWKLADLADRVRFAMLPLERMLLVFVMGVMFTSGTASDFAELCVLSHMPVDSICRLVNVANMCCSEEQRRD
jgi:hypothetical protein